MARNRTAYKRLRDILPPPVEDTLGRKVPVIFPMLKEELDKFGDPRLEASGIFRGFLWRFGRTRQLA